jgi:hypothetical protein
MKLHDMKAYLNGCVEKAFGYIHAWPKPFRWSNAGSMFAEFFQRFLGGKPAL